MYGLVVNSFKSTPAIRRILPVAFYHPRNSSLQAPEAQSTTKVDQFYINPSYPDDTDTPPTMIQHRTSVYASSEWQESNATQSEADVKADRGEAASKTALDEADMEPKLDEM